MTNCPTCFVAFLRVNGCEEELEDRIAMITLMTSLGLTAAHDPVAACFGIGKCVKTPVYFLDEWGQEDYLDAGTGGTTATMDD